MKEDICEGCGEQDGLTYNRYSGMDLCDFCFRLAEEEMEEREWDDWMDQDD